MSSISGAVLFYGVYLSHQELEQALGLEVGADNYEEINRLVKRAGLQYESIGDSVIGEGYPAIGVGFHAVTPYRDPVEVNFELSDAQRALLKDFLANRKIDKEPKWLLAAATW